MPAAKKTAKKKGAGKTVSKKLDVEVGKNVTVKKEEPVLDVEESSEYRYATFNERILASVFDLMLTSFFILPFVPSLNQPPPEIRALNHDLQAGAISTDEVTAQLFDYFIRQGHLASFMGDRVIEFALMGIAIILFWVYKGATPGKMILRMKIIDEKTGEVPTRGVSIVRYLSYLISFFPPFIGFAWIGLNKKRKAWHDIIAGTVVIKTNPADEKYRFIKEIGYMILALLVVFIMLVIAGSA